MTTMRPGGIIEEQTLTTELQEKASEHPEDPTVLQALFQQAVKTSRTDQTLAFLRRLQQRQPWNHQVRRIFIALCLHQEDYVGAMDAIETLVAFSSSDDALTDSALEVRNRLGPRNIEDSGQPGPSISLCMIVRDEQAFLAAGLNAVKTLVDEMVIIDTGSADRSTDIARIYGARVYDFTWCDDFSAARNASLRKAAGDWILVLDADEIIAPQDHAVLRQMVAHDKPTPQAFSFCTRNYTHLANAMNWHANDGGYPLQETGVGWFPTDKVRLFPRSADVRFEYPVHELVDLSIRQAGIRIESSNVPIHHYGHLNEARNGQKARQYFELGYAKLDQLGDNPVALRELAVQAGQLEYWSQSLELWNRFLAIRPQHAEAFANIAGAHWQLGSYDEGVEYARKAVKSDPGLKEGHYNLAVNLIMKDRPERASAVLQAILRDHPHYMAAFFMLAAARRMMGDTSFSRKIFKLLREELSDRVLSIALKDLADKLKRSGLDKYGDLIAGNTV